jgi:hypothetical protein
VTGGVKEMGMGGEELYEREVMCVGKVDEGW